MKICASCEKPFTPNSNRQKNCTDCGRRGFGVCLVCGIRFKRKGNTTGKYCSKEHADMGRSNPATMKRRCPVCGTLFKPQTATQRTCGHACSTVFFQRVCPACGNTFSARQHPDKTTCSRECAGRLRRGEWNTECERCGGPLPPAKSGRYPLLRFCSAACRRIPNGTVRQVANGYEEIRTDSGWIRHHVYLMQEHIGRRLFPGEEVHHRNGVRNDNRIDNLELWPSSHPSGSRAIDLLDWAEEVVARYGPLRDQGLI